MQRSIRVASDEKIVRLIGMDTEGNDRGVLQGNVSVFGLKDGGKSSKITEDILLCTTPESVRLPA
jgi:hypothetical protein